MFEGMTQPLIQVFKYLMQEVMEGEHGGWGVGGKAGGSHHGIECQDENLLESV